MQAILLMLWLNQAVYLRQERPNPSEAHWPGWEEDSLPWTTLAILVMDLGGDMVQLGARDEIL